MLRHRVSESEGPLYDWNLISLQPFESPGQKLLVFQSQTFEGLMSLMQVLRVEVLIWNTNAKTTNGTEIHSDLESLHWG